MNTDQMTGSLQFRRTLAAIMIAALASIVGCAAVSPDYNDQMTFDTPEAAVMTLAAATRAEDASARLDAIFGPDGSEILSSGDQIADRHQREILTVALEEGWSLERTGGSTRELVIGHEDWPFPIPLVKDRRGWWFDTAAGKQEILARRIGRNELWTIRALQTYALAQREYASAGRDGKPAGIFAQKIRSDPGMHNGLYWPATNAEDKPSPFARFASAALAEGYGTQPTELQAPYHGYFYRILTRQGPAANGGAQDYIVNGDMTGGFAMIACPAEYGNGGIMSFLVGPDGVVHESDLGADTLSNAAAIREYNPDSGWHPVD
jgi:hypothetical protein